MSKANGRAAAVVAAMRAGGVDVAIEDAGADDAGLAAALDGMMF